MRGSMRQQGLPAPQSHRRVPPYRRLLWHPAGWGRLDDWRRNQAHLPGRAEAIRRPVEIGLKAKV
ncbi:hypothetical protein [Bradyrhizobium sp. USDA 4504]